MADIESNVRVNIDTSDALAQLKLLQQQISAFQQAMRKAGADNALAARQMQQNLVNSVNATGKFQANIQTIQTSAERFTTSLEKNKLTMGEYFRYAGGASKTFGKLFKAEFETINQVARERVKELQTQYIKLGRDANGAMKAIAVKPLALDMENLGTKTQMAAQRQQLFNQLMTQGSTNLLNFGKNTQWAGRQLMVGFTVPLTLMGSAAAKAYMEIEKASISFKRVYGDINTTSDETEKMARSVRALAEEFTKYGASVADTMDMAAKAAAMGKTGADLLAQVSQAAKLSVLGQVDQNQALETTISLTNAFGVSAADLSKNIDFLNAVENQTVTSIEDLTIAIPKAAPVIQQLGGDVEDLTFFLTAMKEGGINASEGANALKSGLASLINPSKKASDFMASFGISIKGIVEGNKGDVKGTVIGMAKALDTLDPLNRARAIEQMFGKFQFSRISTLFQNVVKEGSQAQTVAGLAKQTAEELSVLSEREMKKISDSPMYKFQKSIQDIQAKLAPVGEAFLKAVTPIMEFVGKVLDGFNNLSEGSKQFITILVTAVAGIGPLLLMTFGLVANGVANIMKLFTNMKSFINKTTKPSDILGEQTGYMNTEQLRAAAIAASLDQAHAKLRQTFTSETQAVQDLTAAYRNAVQAQQAFAGVPGVPTGNPNATPNKYANGVSMVPGPAGAGDIVPALLSPGEAVIPARSAKKYAPVIRGMIAGNLPGFENGTTGAGMRQSVYGPLTQKQTEGLGRTGLQLKEISDEVMAGPYGKVQPTDFGTQISPTSGHSFPAFSVGGIYQKPDGTKVFVKPQMDLTSALAEVRGTTIARDAHGLVAPKQEIRVMMDPTDPENQRRFIVLESALDEKIANIPNQFSNSEYFTQLVASLLRGDKDLGIGNLGGDVLADVGTAGVFGRASGKRALGSAINSMEEQAIINLLGVKGGAKRFFAEATAEQVSKMKPGEYDAAMKAEMARVAPKLQATIAGFGNMSPEEKAAYQAMQQRLQAGMSVDWSKYQVMHSAVPPKKFELGGFAGLTQASHTQRELDKNDPSVISQIEKVYPGIKDEHLQYITVLGNLTADLPTWVNQRLIPTKGGIVPPIFQKVWNSIHGKFNSSAKAAGVPANLNGTLAQIEESIGNTTVRVAAGKNVIDPILADGTREALFSSVSMGGDSAEVANRLLERSNTVGSIRADLGKNANGKLRQLLASGIAEFAPNGKDVVFSGTKIKIGRFALASSSSKPEQRAEQESKRASWIASGAVPSALPEELKLRGSSLPPGSFRRSLTGISSYDELLASISGVSDPNVFDEKAFIGAQKFANGTPNVGATGKPKASVFDIDDTLLDLSSFMAAHKAENDKLPEGEKKKWYKEVAKDPKGIPAGLAALKAAQQRGNKILLMTARPDFYEPYTVETLQKLGIDMNGIKLIARKDKDYRKPEQMKYDKTSKFMKYYDIEEFYDDMDKTRGAVSLLGINAINPLKLSQGVFSVPGPKGAGDVVPAMLTPGEAVIPADKAEKHRGLITQMISGNVAGYNMGTPGVPGYEDGTPKVTKIPGVPDPVVVTPQDVAKSSSLFGRMASTIVDASQKAGEVLKSKALDAADTLLAPIAKSLNGGLNTLVDSKGRTRFDAKTGETFDKKGNVIAKDVKLEKENASKTEGVLRVSREQLEEQISLTDKDYAQVLEEQKLLKAQIRLSDEQKIQFQKNEAIIIAKEEAYMAERNMQEKKQSGLSKAFTRTKLTGRVQGAAYGASGLVGLASTIPDNVLPGVGQAAQAALPAIGAFTGAMSMIPGPAGMVVGGLLAVATIIGQVNAELTKMREESYKLASAMGAGNASIQKFADFAKTVSGTEAMNKKREASAGQFFNVVEGKTTFGESYMKSDAGKQLVKDVGESIKGGGFAQAKTLITQQLSTAIAAGVMTTAQARSIAANLGKQLKSTDFAMSVSAKLTDTFGPNGENLKDNPLQVRIGIAKESSQLFKKFSEEVVEAGANAFGSAEKQGGALAASLQSTFDVQQQMVDSLQIDYEKRIAIARAAGDTAEATRLQTQYLSEQKVLLEANAAAGQEIFNQLKGLDSGVLGQVKTAAIASIESAYKGTGQEAFATIAKDRVETKFVGSNDEQKAQLASLVGSKQIGFQQLETAQTVFGNSSIGANQLSDMLTTKGGVETNRALGLASSMSKDTQRKFLVDFGLADPAKAKQMNDAFELAQKTIGPFADDEVTKKAILDFNVLNADKVLDAKANIDALAGLSGKKITLAVTTGSLFDANVQNAIKRDINRFNKYNDAAKVTYTTELQQIMSMEGDAAMIAAFEVWRREGGNKTKTFADYASYQADRTVKDANIDSSKGPGSTGGAKEFKAPEPSILDPYVKMLREANNYQQKLTTGWNDSFKAIMKYTSASIKQMGGFAVMMQQSGAAAEEIQAFMNGTEEEQNRIVDKKTGKLRKNAAELLKKLKEIRESSEIGLKYVLMSPAERLAKDNELYQAGLDVISIKEKKVNEKYDARIKALDEIGKIQEKNNQRQQDTMSLADALSKGDIAAAARAALQAKQNDQKAALDSARTSLDNARKIELEGIEVKINGILTTRAEIEGKLENNAEKIAGYKLLEAQRVANIEQNALKSATHMAKLVASGKALSLLKPYNPGTPGGPGGPADPGGTNAPALSTATKKVGVGANGKTVVDPVAAAGKAMGGAAAAQVAAMTAWDFKNKKFVNIAKADPNKGKEGYVQDEKTPGKYVLQKTSKFADGVNTFATKAEAMKNVFAGESKAVWKYNADANEGVFEVVWNKGTMKNPIVADALKEKSDHNNPQTLKVKKNQYFIIPEGAAMYKTTLSKNEYNIGYGKKDVYNTAIQPGGLSTGKMVQATPETIKIGTGSPIKGYAMGGMVYASNGIHVEASKYALGTDTIPAMLTPGEFVMRKSAVDSIGANKLSSMNNGTSIGESVYNYSITVNANSSDSSGIADAVLREIQRIDSRRIRSSNI